MWKKGFFLCLALVASFVRSDETCQAGIDGCEAEKSFGLFHSFSMDDYFSQRGDLIFAKSGENKLKLRFSEKAFEMPMTEEIISAVANNSLYRVKLQISEKKELMAFTKMCDLAVANFQQSFTFHLSKSGEIIGFNVAPFTRAIFETSSADDDCESAEFRAKLAADLRQKMAKKEKVIMRSKATASLPTENHQATTGHFRSEAEGEPEMFDELKKEEEGKEEEEQSFLRKYWYIFLPMFLMSMFGGPAPPEQGQQAPAAAAPAPAKGKGRKK